MATFKNWIKAFRMRTLPLALSSIIVGGFLSAKDDKFNIIVSCLAIITTICLQILSNLANDYGDFKTGADNDQRIGPERSVQSGDISEKQMIKAIYYFIALSLVSGLLLIYFGTLGMSFLNFLTFFLFGMFAIGAAVKYTMGKNPYGYKGYGDFFVLIFFGFIGVLGTYYLNTQTFRIANILPAFTIGLFSMAVLNLNNLRDIENDKKSGKKTIVVKLGYQKGKIYHFIIVIMAILSALLFISKDFSTYYQLLFLLIIPLFIFDLIKIYQISNPGDLDPFLKKQAIHTLLFSITFGMGLIL